MSRAKGSKNQPKSLGELLILLQEESTKHGKRFEYSFKEDDGTEVVDTKELFERASGLATFEIETDNESSDEGEDTFTCGKCNAKLDRAESVCPHCGAKLNW